MVGLVAGARMLLLPKWQAISACRRGLSLAADASRKEAADASRKEVAPEMPSFDFTPPKADETLAKRKKFLNPAIRVDSMYIVHMDNSQLPNSKNALITPFSMYSNLLRGMKFEINTISEDDMSTAQPVHVYCHAVHGFSARLTNEEVKVLQNMKGVLGVHPDRVRTIAYHPHS